jgi:uncharacterized protein (DUF697 family)
MRSGVKKSTVSTLRRKVFMSLQLLQHVRQALNHLNPSDVEADSGKIVRIRLRAASEPNYLAMEELFQDDYGGWSRRIQLARAEESAARNQFDFDLVEIGLTASKEAVSFDPAKPDAAVLEIVRRFDEFDLALAANCPLFRVPVANKKIMMIAKENALFSAATSLPNMMPLISLPFTVTEFASDTAFLTMNQIRLGFLLAASFGRPVGYSIQKKEIASVIASAFGWRAIARTLVSKIPFGGGIAPKAAIAFAGTFLVGKSLIKYYETGEVPARAEQKKTYEAGLQKGQRVAKELAHELPPQR